MKTIRSSLTIVDKFLTEDGFQYLKSVTDKNDSVNNTTRLFWLMSNVIDKSSLDDLTNTQLVHSFDSMGTMDILHDAGIFDRLGVIYMLRAKMNVQFKTSTNIVGGMHYDLASDDFHAGLTDVDEYTGCGVKTAVLYMNDCNGGTQFEDGTFIQSKANRLVEFPRELKHSGVTATDADRRTVLNLNYVPMNYFPARGKNRFQQGNN